MMRSFIPLASVALLLCASPAHADWQYSRWGMSPDQTAAASVGSVTVGQGDPNDRHAGSELGATGTYASGDYRFKANFYFKNDKLVEVRLTLNSTDPNGDNIKLRNSMQGQYGVPYQSSGFITTFHDVAKNNRVDLMIIAGTGARLIYRPLRDESAGGL